MKLAFQGINNGGIDGKAATPCNGKLVLTADNLKFACTELGIPDDAHTLRRAARAFDLYHSGKVEHVNNHTFKVASQYDRQEPYEVKIKQTPYLKAGGYAYCTCQDWMNYSGDQDLPDVNFWCKHSIAALVWLHNRREGTSLPVNNNGNGNGKREFTDACRLTVVNECGSNEAKAIQDKLNGQIDSQKNADGRAQALSSQPQLDQRAMRYTTPSTSNPFEESESYDIDQIEGRRNGEVTWKLRNGEYVISYRGIMTLAEKHGIEYEVSLHDDTNTVIAKAMNGNERVSGKEIKIAGSIETASELAKRNAARQLLPLPEIKAVEHKAKLEAEFSWEKAKAKCVELVGSPREISRNRMRNNHLLYPISRGEANVGIIIHDLTQAGKLRQDNPSHYNRTEWLVIFNACQKDAQVERDPKSLNRWSYNSVEFLDRCREAIAGCDALTRRLLLVRENKDAVEANEMPMQNSNGNKRKVQMDKKLRTWLVETDGTKKEISCREICETFESKQNPSIVTRLRAGIDSGADFSTVDLN